MQNTAQLLFNIKKDLSLLLIDKMEKQEITLERGKDIAQTILTRLPDNIPEEQIQQSLAYLKDNTNELSEVIQNYKKQFDNVLLQKARINLEVIKEDTNTETK